MMLSCIMSLILFIFIFCLLPLCPVTPTLSKSDRKIKSNIQPTSVREKNVVPDEQGSEFKRHSSLADVVSMEMDEEQRLDILQRHSKLYTGVRKFIAPLTMGYVTPWNNHGYDVAKWAAKKFTHISPVWFQLKYIREKKHCGLTGTHDIDQGWIADIRQNNSAIKIIPRILFEGWIGDDLKQFLMDRNFQNECAYHVTQFLKSKGMDGAVLEIWLQVMAMTQGEGGEQLLDFLESVGEKFRKKDLVLILPMPPALNANRKPIGIIAPVLIPRLASTVDFINLMTYDYPSDEITGVAPRNWIEANLRYFLAQGVDSGKILMGINFYGYDRTGRRSDAILGPKFLEFLLRPDSMLVYDPASEEYRVEFERDGVAYFPTAKSLEYRLNLALELNIAGIGIWELGQGLDYFTEVL